MIGKILVIGATFVAGYATSLYVNQNDMFMNDKRIQAVVKSVDLDRKNERYLDRMIQDAVQKKLTIDESGTYKILRDSLGPKGLQAVVGNQVNIDYIKQKQELRDAMRLAAEKAIATLDEQLNMFEKSAKYNGRGD